MRIFILPNRKFMKKLAAVSFSAVYVQVNVAWAGVPTLPLFSHLKTQSEIFVFHSPRPWEEIMRSQKNDRNTPENLQRQIKKEEPSNAVALSGRSAKRVSDLPEGPIRSELQKTVGKDTQISKVTFSELMSSLQKAGVVLSSDKKTQLAEAFASAPGFSVSAHKSDTGQIVFDLNNASNGGTVVINQRFLGRSDDSVTMNIQAKVPVAAKAAEPKAAVSASVPEFKASVISREAKTETKANFVAEQKLAGAKVTIGGMEVRLKMDPATRALIPTNVKTGERITGKVFTSEVKDAAGASRNVSFAVHHVEMENGQLVAKGPMTVDAGVRFKDGQLDKAAAATGAGRELGGPTSHGLNVTIENNQIFFEGKAGGGEVAFSAAVTETGKVEMDQAQFNPVTAGAHDVTILSDLGTVLAEVGAQKKIETSVGQTFTYSQWNIVDKAAAGTDSGKAVLSHFNVSETNSTLINNAGLNVGQVSLNDKKQITQIVGNTTTAGQESMKAIFFNNPAALAKGWAAQKVEVGMTSTSGRAVVILNDKATLPQTLNTLKAADAVDIKGKSATQISQVFVALGKADAGAQKIDLSAAGLRVSGGRDNLGAILAPTISTSDQKLAQTVFGKANVESAQNTFNAVMSETGKAPTMTAQIFSQTGTGAVRVTGNFLVPGTNNTASVTVAKNDADGRAPPTVQYDRAAAMYFHSEAAVTKNETAANNFLEAKSISAAKGDFTYSASLNQLTVTKTFDVNMATLRSELTGSITVSDGKITNFSVANAQTGVEVQMDDKATINNAAFLVSRVNGATPEAKEQSLKNLFTESNKQSGLLGATVRLTDTTVARATFVVHENKLQPLVTLTNVEKQTAVTYFGAKMNYSDASKHLTLTTSANFKNTADVSTFFKSTLTKDTFDKGLVSISVRVGNDTFTGQFANNSKLDVAKTFTGISVTQTNTASSIQYLLGNVTEVKGGFLAQAGATLAGFLEKTGVTKALQKENLPTFVQNFGKAIESFKVETRVTNVDGTRAAQSLSSRMAGATTAAKAESVAIDVFKTAATSIDKGLANVSFAREGKIFSVSNATVREMRGAGAVVSNTDVASKTSSRYVVNNRVDGRAAANNIATAVSGAATGNDVQDVLENKFTSRQDGVLSVSREIEDHVISGSFGRNVEVSGAVIDNTNLETKTTVRTIKGVTADGEKISANKNQVEGIAEMVGAADTIKGARQVLVQELETPVRGLLSVSREIGDTTLSGSYGDNVRVTYRDGSSAKVSGADITQTNNVTGTQIRTIGDTAAGENVMNQLDNASSTGEVRTILENTFANGTGTLLSAGRTIDKVSLSGSHYAGGQIKATGAAITETNLETGVTVRTLKGFEILANSEKSPISINGTRAGREIAAELTKAEGRDGVVDTLETFFSKPHEGVLSAGREVLGYNISGEYKDGEQVAQGKTNIFVTGASLTEVHQLTGTVASWMVGTSLLADSKTAGPAINTRSGARALATQVDRAESWSDAAEILSSGLQKPLAGVSVTREFDGVVVSGSHRNGLKTGDGITASGASVEITDLSTSRTVQIVTGKGVTAEGKEVTVNGGLKAVDGIAQKLDSAKNPDEVKNALVDIFKTGVEGVVRASREIDGKVVSGEHGSRVEVKDKSLATGAVLTTTDKALDTTVRTIVGNYLDANGKVDSARSIDGRKTGERIAEAVGAAKGVEGTAAALKNIFGQFQEGVLGASRVVDNHVVSGRHGSDTTTGPKPETRWGAVLTDLNLKTGVSVETFNDKTVDGWSAGQSASVNIGKEWTLSGTVYALKSEFGKKVDGLRSASREVEGHALSATYQEGVHVRGLDQNEMKAQGAVIRDTNLKTGMTVTTMNGVLLDKENRSYGRLDGYSSGQVLARDADMTQVGNEAKKGQLLSWGVLSVEQRNADGSTLRIDMKADMPVQDASNKEMGQFTGGLQSLISESGQIVTALVGNISRDGVKEEVDQRANVGAFQNEVSGKNYTEARQAAADLIKSGNLKEGVYSYSARTELGEVQIIFGQGTDGGKEFSGAVVSETNFLTGTTTNALVGRLSGKEVNGLELSDSMRLELGSRTINDFEEGAKVKLDATDNDASGVLNVSRREGGRTISVSRDAVLDSTEGGEKIRQQRRDGGWVVDLGDREGRVTGGKVVSKDQIKNEIAQLRKDLADLKGSASKLKSGNDVKQFFKEHSSVGEIEVIVEGQRGWSSRADEKGNITALNAYDRGTGAVVGLQNVHTWREAGMYLNAIGRVQNVNQLRDLVRRDGATNDMKFRATSMSFRDADGNRYTSNEGEQDKSIQLVQKNGSEKILVVHNALTSSEKIVIGAKRETTDANVGSAEVSKRVDWVTSAGVTELDKESMRTYGFGQTSVILKDGTQVAAVVEDTGRLAGYKKEGVYRDADNGQTLNEAVISNGVNSDGGEIKDVVNFVDGKKRSHAQLKEGANAEQAKTQIRANNENMAGWEDMVSKGPVQSATLYNRDIKSDSGVNSYGNIVLKNSPEESSERGFTTTWQISQESFGNQSGQIKEEISDREGQLTVQTGYFTRDGGFSNRETYANAGGNISVTLFDDNGNTLSAVADSDDIDSVAKALRGKIDDVRAAAASIKSEGWIPEGANSVKAADKFGNGVEQVDDWGANTIYIHSGAKIEKTVDTNGKINSVTRTINRSEWGSSNIKTDTNKITYIDGMLATRMTENFEGDRVESTFNNETGKWSNTADYNINDTYWGFVNVSGVVRWTAAIAVGVVAAVGAVFVSIGSLGFAALPAWTAVGALVIGVASGFGAYQAVKTIQREDVLLGSAELGLSLLPGAGLLLKGTAWVARFFMAGRGAQAALATTETVSAAGGISSTSIALARAGVYLNYAVGGAFMVDSANRFVLNPTLGNASAFFANFALTLWGGRLAGRSVLTQQANLAKAQTIQVSQTTQRIGLAVGMNRVLVGSTLQGYFRNEVARALGTFVDKPSWSALGDVAWKALTSEIYAVAPWLGNKIGGISVLKSWQAQGLLVLGAGAIVGGGFTLVTGGSWPEAGWATLKGATLGAAVFGAGVLSGLFVKGGEKVLQVSALSLSRFVPQSLGGFFGASFSAARAILTELGPLAINSVAVGLSNIAISSVFGSAGSKEQDFKQGLYIGAFGGGVLRAIGNWGAAGRALNQFTAPFEQAFDRAKAGFAMGAWEVVFNTAQFSGSLVNPLTWANGVSSLIYSLTDAMGLTTPETRHNDNRDVVTKFRETFLNIAALHPFFGFGRPGVNILSRPFESAAGFVGQRATGVLSVTAVISALGSRGLQWAVINPINIKTFEFYEKAAVFLADKVGFVELKKDLKGNYLVDEAGYFIAAKDKDKLGVSVFQLVGFLNSPIHKTVSAGEKIIGDKLAAGRIGLMEQVPGLGGLIRKMNEADRAEALFVAGEIQNGTTGRAQSTSGEVEVRLADGRNISISGEGLSGIRAQAQTVLAQNKETRELIGQAANTTLDAISINREGKVTELKESDALKSAVKGVTREDALLTLVQHQSGRQEVSKDKLAEAQKRLGVAEGERIVLVDKDVITQAQQYYVEYAPRSALGDIIENAAQGKYELSVGVMAVARVYGKTTARDFEAAGRMGVDSGLLTKIGKDEAGVKTINGERILVLAGKDVSSALRAEVVKSIPAELVSGGAELVLIGKTPGLRFNLNQEASRKLVDSVLEKKAGERSEMDLLGNLGLFEKTDSLTITVALSRDNGVEGIKVVGPDAESRGQALVDIHGNLVLIAPSKEVVQTAVALNTAASIEKDHTTDFVQGALNPSVRSASRELLGAVSNAVKTVALVFGLGALLASPAQAMTAGSTLLNTTGVAMVGVVAAALVLFKASFAKAASLLIRPSSTLMRIDSSGRVEEFVNLRTGSALSDYLSAREKVSLIQTMREKDELGGMTVEGLNAAEAYHSKRADLLLKGYTLDQVKAHHEVQTLGQDYVLKGEFTKRISAIKTNLEAAIEKADKNPNENSADIKTAVEGLKQQLAKLEGDPKSGKSIKVDALMLDRVMDMEAFVSGTSKFIGAMTIDRENLKKMITDIRNMTGNVPAQEIMLEIVERIENHINAKEEVGEAAGQRFLEIYGAFTRLREVYGLESRIDANGKETNANFGKLSELFKEGTTAQQRRSILEDIFKTNPNRLDIGQRLALSLALSDRYFQTYKDGKEKSQGALDKDAKERVEETHKVKGSDGFRVLAEDKKIFNSRQGVLLVQFMLGRIGGLEAGGGKTAIFILGFGDYLLKGAENKELKRVGELVAFASGEVEKYVGEYAPLARAFGIKVFDGRNFAGEAKRKEAVEAYKPEGDSFHLVISDLHSRGFLERQLRAEPTKELSTLVKDNVGVLGLDEVDALLLSRMSFISSEGNMKAQTKDLNRIRPMIEAVLKVLGIDAKDPKIDFGDRTKIKAEGDEKAGYRDFNGGAPTDKDINQGLWFSSVNGDVKYSKAFMEKIRTELKGKEFTSNELREVLRALIAVSDKDGFGFARGENNSEKFDRPTHIAGGKYSHGQIDSSLTFNVAAVLFERSARKARGKSSEEIEAALAALPENNIRLSDAGSMATFVQVLQRDIHRFGATGTPKALLGLSEKTVGLRIVDVAPSSFKNFQWINTTFAEGAWALERANGAGQSKKVSVITQVGGITAKQAGEVIMRSVAEEAGILVGSLRQDVLRTMFVGYLREIGGEKIAEAIKDRSDLGIRGLVDLAKSMGEKESNATLTEGLKRVEVIDGEGNVEGVVKAAAPNKLVVFTTAVGLRALSYDANVAKKEKIDLLLAGVEASTTEGYLQGLARVDRGSAYGARRTMFTDPTYIDTRVETANKVNKDLVQSRGRTEGVFVGVGESRLRGLVERVPSSLSLIEKIELAAGFSSSENKAASAMFFINEQTTSKLLKEPLQDMIARETSAAGKEFLTDLYMDVLRQHDQRDVPEDTVGADYQSPSKIAEDAFVGGAKQALAKLGKILNSPVSKDLQIEVAGRMADITHALAEIREMTRDTVDGLHGKSYEDSAYVGVSSQSNGNPAMDVARVSAALSDYLLPNTSTTKAKEGAAAAVQQLYSARNNLPDATSNTRASVESFADSLHSASFNKDAAPKSTPEGRLLNETEQAVAVSFVALNKLENKDRLSLARGLYAAGMISSNPGNKEDAAPSAQVLAAQVVTAWMGGKGSMDQFDFDAVVQAAAVIGAVGGFNTVEDKRDAVINVASTPGALRQEAIARNVVTLSKNNPGFLQERAQRVVDLTQQSRAKQAEMGASQPSSSNWIVKAAQWVGFTARALTAQINSPDKQLKNLGKNERLSDVFAKVRAEANGQQLDVRVAANQAVAYIALTRPNLTATTVSNLRSRVVELYSRSGDEAKTNATVDELLTWAGQDKATSLDQSNFDKAATDSMKVGESKLAKQWMTGAAIVAGLSVATLGLATAAGAGFAAWMGLALVNGFALNNVSKALVQAVTGDRQSWAAPKIPFKKDSSAKTQNLFETVRTLFSTPKGRWTLGTTAALTAAATLTFGGMLPVPVLMGLSIGGSLVSQLGKNLGSRAQAALILSVGALVGVVAMQIPTLAAFGMSAATMEIGWVKGLLGTGGSLAAGAVGAAVVWGAATGILNVTTTIRGETREKALARIEFAKQATVVREQIKKDKAEAEKTAFAQKGGPQIELKGAEAQLAQIRGDKKAQQQNFEGWFSALQRVNGRIDELKKEIREKAGVSEKTDVGDLVDGIEKAIADGKIDPKNKYLVLKYALMQEGLSEKRATEVAAKIKAGEKEDASAKEKKDADTLKVMTADELKDEKTDLGLLIELKQFEMALERRGQPLDARAIDNYGWSFRGNTISNREEAAVAVYNHLFGRETTTEERRSLKRLSENLESFSGSLKTQGVKIPSLRELATAINQGTAATFFSDVLGKSNALPALVQAASGIATERKEAMGKIRQELTNQGIKSIEIDRFMTRLFRYDSYTPAQQTQISDALDQMFKSDNRDTPVDTRNTISAILANTVFNPAVIARRGVTEKSTLTASAMKMLEGVAYSRSEKVSAYFNNWASFAPLYRTLSLLKLGSSPTVAKFDGAKNELTVNTVGEDGITLTPVARLQRSWSGNEVVVELVESNSVIRFGATELSVEAKNKTKVETKVGGTENWTSVPTAQLVTKYLVSNGISEVRVGGVSFNNPLYGVTSETAPEAKAEVAPAKPATPTTPETPATPQAVESRAKIPAPPAVPQPNAEPVVAQREAAAPAPAASAPAAPASAVAAPAAQEVAPVPAPISSPAQTSLIGLVILYAFAGIGRIQNAVKAISGDAWNSFSSITIRVFDNLGLNSMRKFFFGVVLATAALFGSGVLRAQGTNIVNVPVATANVPKMQFQSVQSFGQTFLAQTGDKTERVFARTVDRTDGGVTIGVGREFRQVTLVGAPSYETGAIRELAQLLLAEGTTDAPEFKAGSTDKSATTSMQKLLNNPQVRDWVRAIDVSSLLKGQALPTSIETTRFQTLGQVVDLGREMDDFKSFVYALVLFNAESLATKAGTMLSSDSVERVSRELGGNIVLHHTQPGRAIASLEDRLAARRLFVLGGRIGHVNDVPLIVSNSTSLTLFDDIRSVLLTMDAVGKPQDVKPVTMPYQNFNPSADDFVDHVNRADREASPAAKALAKAALNLAVELFQEKNLSPDQLRLVWGLVQELALGHAVRAEDALARAGLSGLGLEQIISELSSQIRALGETNPAVRSFATNGHLRDIGPHIHYYLNISATPSNPAQFDKWIESSEASWIIENLGLDIDDANGLLLDPAAARERAEELRQIVNDDAHEQDVFATLRILAGLYESDFFTRMLAQMKGRFTTMAEVEAALAGSSKDRAAQETALRLLMKPLIYAVLEATNARNPELVDDLMKKIDLTIVTADQLTNGKSKTTENGGRISIQIGLDEGLTTQQAFVESVGRLTHEISDVLAHRSLRKYALGELGVPTVLSEAWSALTTERALRWLKLDSIADTLALQTAERIAAMEQSQAYYLTYSGLRGKPQVISALERKVRDSKGATQIVVLASESEYEAAQFELANRGIQLASPAQIMEITPANGETALEAHGRLYLGTRALKLVADEASFKADTNLERIVSLKISGGWVRQMQLLTLLSPAIYTDRLEQIVQEQLVARLVGRQA